MAGCDTRDGGRSTGIVTGRSDTRRHLDFVLAAPAADVLHGLRLRWDPIMAARCPPHVTLTYPEESGDEARLLGRCEAAARWCPPFQLEPGTVVAEGDGAGGVFVALGDPTGRWEDLRRDLLRRPFAMLDVRPHATIVHPRTSRQGPTAWRALRGTTLTGRYRLACITYTETGPGGHRVLRSFPLTGPAGGC